MQKIVILAFNELTSNASKNRKKKKMFAKLRIEEDDGKNSTKIVQFVNELEIVETMIHDIYEKTKLCYKRKFTYYIIYEHNHNKFIVNEEKQHE